jgi:hypothetical protein
MPRATRASQSAAANVPTTSDPAEVEKIPKNARSSSTNSVNRRVVHVNGEESDLLDSQEATRYANEATENVFLFVPNLIGELLVGTFV